MSSTLRTAVAGALLAASVPTQSPWIADGANAPDADFTDLTDLPPAVASPGDVVLIRYAPGIFCTGITIDEPLSIVVDKVSAGPVLLSFFALNGSDPKEPPRIVRNCVRLELLETRGEPSERSHARRDSNPRPPV